MSSLDDFGDILLILLFVGGSLISAVAKAFKSSNKQTRPIASSPRPSSNIPSDPFDFEITNDYENSVKEVVPKVEKKESKYNLEDRFGKKFFNEGERVVFDDSIKQEEISDLNTKSKPHPILRGVNISDAIIYSEIFNRKF